MVDAIINFIFQIIQIIFQQAIILTFTKTKIKPLRLVASTIFIYGIYLIALRFFASYLTYGMLAIYLLLMILSYFLILQQSFFKSCVLGIGQMVLITCVEHLGQLLIAIAGAQVREIVYSNNNFWGKIVAIIILSIIFTALKKLNFSFKRMISEGRMPKIWIFYLIFFLFYSHSRAVTHLYSNSLSSSPEIYNLAIFVVFFAYSMMYIYNVQKTVDLKKQLEVQQLYSNTMEKSYNELRNFKHDFSNIINAISGAVKLGDLQSVERCIGSLNVQLMKMNTTDIVNDTIIKKMPMLYGVLLSKLHLAELNGIEFSITIMDEPVLAHIDQLDISRIIGILLDNAIEAASLCKHKFISMETAMKRSRNYITIINSCKDPVDTQVINNKGHTTKEGHDGVGLTVVHEIIDKYIKRDYLFELKSSYSNHIFTQTLII